MTILHTNEGSRRVCTKTNEVPTAPRRTFEPDFGIKHTRAPRWFERFNFWQRLAAVGAVICFVVGVYRCLTP